MEHTAQLFYNFSRNSFMGTPEYMCPEMIMTKSRDQAAAALSYGCSCDWWACGVLLYASARCLPSLLFLLLPPARDAMICLFNTLCMYEMLCGCTPFVAKSISDIFIRVHKDEITFGPSFKTMPEAVDLIKQLCDKDPRKRMGCRYNVCDVGQGVSWCCRAIAVMSVQTICRIKKALIHFLQRVLYKTLTPLSQKWRSRRDPQSSFLCGLQLD
jgi:serine/threonine protein kinase